MVLFIKKWASLRKINSSRNGTLSSYGYVLMVLHFLVHVEEPAVCPNLQRAVLKFYVDKEPDPRDPTQVIDGFDTRFWGNLDQISEAARENNITRNNKPLGALLHDFFLYYGAQGAAAPDGGFAWTRDVLSLRTPTGLVSKQTKGWTGAKTTIVDRKEVKNRYLFAIEDPFEITHNIARTVTHFGLVAIRDEFRRAWRIILSYSGRPGWVNNDGDLMDELISIEPPKEEPQLNNQADAEAQNQGSEVEDEQHAGAATVASVMNSLGFAE